ncbi:MAG: DUF3489 domain-containing protein [Bradyrhizobium sp.]|nr:MAG: DUF3489 domain-containing protein [Bradyrhizobium sp.]
MTIGPAPSVTAISVRNVLCYPSLDCRKLEFSGLQLCCGETVGKLEPQPKVTPANSAKPRNHWLSSSNRACMRTSLGECPRTKPTLRRSLRSGVRVSDGAGLAGSSRDAKGTNMPTRLSETQRTLLNAARQRKDQCLTLPTGAKLAQVRNMATKLKATNLVKEIKAKADAPVWRQDKSAGQFYSLKLTAAGLKAIAASEAAGVTLQAPDEANAGANGRDAIDPGTTANTIKTGDGFAPVAPLEESKLAAVITMLLGQQGATLDQLVKATGWLPHTTRAALTGLRKRGYALTLDRSDRNRDSIYRIAPELASGRENTTAAVADIANTKDAISVSKMTGERVARGSDRRHAQSRSDKAKARKAA